MESVPTEPSRYKTQPSYKYLRHYPDKFDFGPPGYGTTQPGQGEDSGDDGSVILINDPGYGTTQPGHMEIASNTVLILEDGLAPLINPGPDGGNFIVDEFLI